MLPLFVFLFIKKSNKEIFYFKKFDEKDGSIILTKIKGLAYTRMNFKDAKDFLENKLAHKSNEKYRIEIHQLYSMKRG